MANPQAENGHIDIANELGEAFFRLQLSGNQWRLLWVVFRQTYGWHKKTDRISISQFEGKTGIKRRHVVRALLDMVERKIITKNDTTFISTYGFQKDYLKWDLLPKKTLVPKNDTKTVTKIGTHKRNSKETILRDSEKPNPAVKKFIDFWYQSFQEKFKSPYPVNGGKDGASAKALLKTYPLDRLKTLAVVFFKSQDPFILKSGYSIPFFHSQISKVVVEESRGKPSW